MSREVTKQALELLVEALPDPFCFYKPHTDCNGASIVFSDKSELSVRWGRGNYGSRRDDPSAPRMLVELALFDPEGNFTEFYGPMDQVLGWQTFDDVAALASVAAERAMVVA